MAIQERFQVGIISSTHGIRGEVKVFPTTDDARRFKRCKELILDTGREELMLEVESVKFFKQFVILKFKGIDSINDVEKYKNKSLFVTRENAVRLNKDEYFIADLIGMEIVDESNGQRIGELKDVMETGANDVYVVACDEGKELLFPAIKECVKDIDFDTNKITVHVMDGLLDL